MPKLSETYSKWKSIGEGLLAIVLGLLLIRFGQVIPRMGYQLLMGYFSLSAVWHLLTRWFQDKKRRENIFVTLGKLVVAALVFDSIILQDLALYLLVFIIASSLSKKCHSSSAPSSLRCCMDDRIRSL